ncbi:family 43 glycosylhydrolase [Cellulophaga sp. L1A9]|uniref:family 43 glycosylhydrolase n=1 Tax=Cellulophaga sp. L1A9 TaxID=2686362 RepID=UPI00131E43A7|nr:family 43 glycosylhydrolase [Cellulophaga sp. L1A9]
MKLKLGIITIVVCLIASCNNTKKEKSFSKEIAIKENAVKFTYQEVAGIGKDSTYNRRDNSDIIKVNDTYHIWYSRMDSPVTAGYWATIWHATSTDEGHTWKEQSMALGLGAEGEFDNHSVFTPNILVRNGKYYMYYTGVKPTPGRKDKKFEGNSTTDITAIGLAVANSPDGPFVRVENNPVLEISKDSTDFDSFRIDDASLLVRDNKIALYYKGRQWGKSPAETKMSVAYANHPEGPFTKYDGYLLDESHEVLIWQKDGGVASLASINATINFAADGEHFSVLNDSLKNIPKAPGLYRPVLENGNPDTEIPGWGIAMKSSKGLTYLLRFEIK